MDWHGATISRRGQLYFVMTVPHEARAAMGGQAQVRISARTTDMEIAKKRRHDAEAELRRRATLRVQQERLRSQDSAYQRAVRELGLADETYSTEDPDDMPWDAPKRVMRDPPRDELELIDAETAFGRVEPCPAPQHGREGTTGLELGPRRDEAKALARAALAEAKRALGTSDDGRPTLLNFLPAFEEHSAQRVVKGTMKLKTAKAGAKNIRQFAERIGDPPLADFRPTHAYAYAESMTGSGNTTIKTRVSDVCTMLGHAVAKGLIDRNRLPASI